jgi:predicted DNA-binding protein
MGMIRKQVFITKEQDERLKRVAASRGTPAADLIRKGIDQALKEAEDSQDWRTVLERLSGAWVARDDMQDFVRDLRKGGRRRLERLGLTLKSST